LIRRGKTDAEGQGRAAFLSRESCRWLVGQNRVGGPLNPGSIAPIFKRVAQWIGLPAKTVAKVSGHSTRVGATQDLAALDIDLAAITQAGGWEVHANAATVCREDQRGAIRDGEGGREDGETVVTDRKDLGRSDCR
jgi:hypothetical protein